MATDWRSGADSLVGMSRGLGLIWLLVFVFALVFIGQLIGLYDLPVLRDLRLPVAFGPPEASPTLSVPSPSIALSPSPVAARPTVSTACGAAGLSFVHGMADLKAALGAAMGDPIECERVVDSAGNTEQQTTTGLAYYRAQANVVVFTNGVEHWALTSNGVVHWVGDEVEPPAGAEPARLP